MRHGRLIGWLAPALFAALLFAALQFSALPATAQEGRDVNVRSMVLAEPRIAPGAQQLLQVTLSNTHRRAIVAGLRAELRDERDRRVGSPVTRRVRLAGKDEERFLFKFRAPAEQGDYALRFEVLTDDFRAPLIPGGPVFFAPFVVGQGARARVGTALQARVVPPNFLPPSGLTFERPDLLWESLAVNPKNLLVGEPLRIKGVLRNVGGDLARNVQIRVVYFNSRTPNRQETISDTAVQVLAPGEKLELEFETVLPDNAVLGEYRVTLVADSTDSVDELDENNNQVATDPIQLTRIKLIFPEPNFAFEEQGLFLFRWDSLRYDEFKVQVGTSATFSEEGTYFDLPQGEKWAREKEIVPLEGELPAMAQGLIERTGAKRLYWRVEGRDSKTGRTAFSETIPFSITAQPSPRETAPPASPQAGPGQRSGGAGAAPAR